MSRPARDHLDQDGKSVLIASNFGDAVTMR